MKTQAAMVGWAHTRFGRLDDETLESLVQRVTTEALADAGIDAAAVDSIHIGNLGGFDAQSFPAALPLQAAAGLRFKPATRYENACASGSAALHGALDRIAAGRSEVALVIGVEKMNALTTPEVARVLAGCSYQPEEGQLSFPGIFAQMAQAYFERHGEQLDALAHIAAKNHANGALNPWAHIRKDLGFAYCRHESERNRVVAPPLKVSDCSTVADGAAAMIVVAPGRIGEFAKAVGFRATAQVTDYLPMSRRDPIALFERQLEESGVLDAGGRAAVQAEIDAELDAAVAEAEASPAPFPDPEFRGVRADEEAAVRRRRETFVGGLA